MNVERLHRILIDLDLDLKTDKIITLVQQIRDHLQNQVNQPNQPTHQTNLVNSLNNLYKALENSKFNDYSPSWKEIISEISGEIELGIPLKNRIETILASNSITPANALEEIKKIFDNLQTFQTAIKNTLTGLKALGIEEEDLEAGQCELGYTIPREYVDNKLSELKDEISELNFILNNISEAVTGEKQEYEVKTISSSDFLLYVIIALQVADVLSNATERILNIYKGILEIKLLRNQLKEQGIPASKTKSIDTHANGMMKDEIKAIVKEVMDEHYDGDNGRKNELQNGLTISLNKLANRIDKGFNVEIRVEPLPEPEEEEATTPEYEQNSELIKSIQESARKIEFLDTGGESILKLPEKK
ncbi:hypothetical protein [uncultured Polaribacter sp.]|uniref:hypothetical protein n=1 Tax=uncultured Polaribacter sp. TaxID=174711 RepID=UPI0026339B0F|nr:hypothetical protein [uncultured Polaribacter sp.]